MELSFKSNDATIKLTKTAITKEDFDRVYEIISSNYVVEVTPVQEFIPNPIKNILSNPPSKPTSKPVAETVNVSTLDANILKIAMMRAPEVKPLEETIKPKPVETEAPRKVYPPASTTNFKREEVKVKVSSCPSCGHTGQQRVLRGSKFVNCDVCGEKLFLKPAGATWNEQDEKGNEYLADSLYFEKKEY